MNANVRDLVRRSIAIDRRVDDRVIDERDALLAEAVPASRIVLVRIVEFGVGAEGGEEGGLVVGRTAEPTVGDARPFGDRVAAGDELLHIFRRLEEGVREAAVAGVGRQQELVLAFGVMQGVVEPSDHARGVAERRMGRDVLNPLPVDIDLTAVAKFFEIFGARHRREAARRRGLLSVAHSNPPDFSNLVPTIPQKAPKAFAQRVLFDIRTFVRYTNSFLQGSRRLSRRPGSKTQVGLLAFKA